MSEIDRKRWTAVKALEERGGVFKDAAWAMPVSAEAVAGEALAAADGLHAVLVRRAGLLAGCLEGSDEEAELAVIGEALETYARQRGLTQHWPLGKTTGSKG